MNSPLTQSWPAILSHIFYIFLLVSDRLGVIFVALAIVSISYDDIVITKVITDSWEKSNITTMKSNRAGNTSSQTVRQVVNEADDLFYLSVESKGSALRMSVIIPRDCVHSYSSYRL